jgi:carbon starvation protein
MYRFRKGKILEATIIGVTLLMAAVIGGRFIPGSSVAGWFTLSAHQLTVAIAAYGFIASVLPVWMLLCPRDYLSSFMKIGTIAALALGIFLVHPDLKMPAFTAFTAGGGPIIPGKLYPFVFITIACGAISGFHALVGSGTTPKMINRETDARVIGYGAMLMEGFVGVMAFIAATSLYPGDYFAINVPVDKFAALGMPPVNLAEFSSQVGESLAGRTGGAVSLAVGMAQIFSSVPGLKGLMSYWYHFAIMFEALFILTTIDTGTRVARFMVQEFLGKAYKPLERTDWLPGAIGSSLLVVVAWSYFIWTGSISTIWPMFGVSNQLLASIALCVGTTVLINSGKLRYAWITILPLSFVATTTLTAGWLNIVDNFLPLARTGGHPFQGYLNALMTAVMMACVLTILVDSVLHWTAALRSSRAAAPAAP